MDDATREVEEQDLEESSASETNQSDLPEDLNQEDVKTKDANPEDGEKKESKPKGDAAAKAEKSPPFHLHPRWKQREEELKELRAKVKEYESQQQTTQRPALNRSSNQDDLLKYISEKEYTFKDARDYADIKSLYTDLRNQLIPEIFEIIQGKDADLKSVQEQSLQQAKQDLQAVQKFFTDQEGGEEKWSVFESYLKDAIQMSQETKSEMPDLFTLATLFERAGGNLTTPAPDAKDDVRQDVNKKIAKGNSGSPEVQADGYNPATDRGLDFTELARKAMRSLKK